MNLYKVELLKQKPLLKTKHLLKIHLLQFNFISLDKTDNKMEISYPF
jgi:hypothetical protein